MTRTVRSRRAEMASQPLYARVLRLRNLAPSGLLCFVFLEGAVVLGALLALAELVSWWGVLVLPITVALMVKFNDLVAGTFTPVPVTREPARARAAVLRPAMPEAGFLPADSAEAFPAAQSSHLPDSAEAFLPVQSSCRPGFAEVLPPASSEALPPVQGGYGVGGDYGAPQTGDHARGQAYAQPVAGYARAGAAEESAGRSSAGGARGGAPRRHWADQLDVRQQVARQAAARRYE